MKSNPVNQARFSGVIPCLVITHGRDFINKQSLSSIIDCDERLEIDVVHNPSESEDGSFIEFARECALAGRIRSFTLFDDNISNNAMFVFLLSNLERYSADYAILTDGDIFVPQSPVDEQMAIFKARPDVMACGLRIDASTWDDSLTVKADCVARYNSPLFESEHCLDTPTGLWMTMFRGQELVSMAETMRGNQLRLTDGKLRHLGASMFQKRWVATKQSVGRELNREQPDYYDVKSVSTQDFASHSPEPAGSRYATWIHDLSAPASQWHAGQEQRVDFPSPPPAVARFRQDLEGDPVIRELRNGSLRRSEGYLVKHLMFVNRPGLAFVLRDGPCLTGIPRLPGDRSVLFISPRREPGSNLHRLDQIDVAASLIRRELEECLPVLDTLSRFLGRDSVLHGLVFSAQAVREALTSGNSPESNHLPPTLREPMRQSADSHASDEGFSADELVTRLWTDEAVSDWLARRDGSFQIRKSSKRPFLAHFRIQI